MLGYVLIVSFYTGSVFMKGISFQHFYSKTLCEAVKKTIDKEDRTGVKVECIEVTKTTP